MGFWVDFQIHILKPGAKTPAATQTPPVVAT